MYTATHGKVQDACPQKFCSENFLVSRTLTGFGILIKLGRGCGIKAEVFKVYLKTKKMTDISQTQAGCKAKSLGILCGFQGFLTQNPAVFVEID